MPELPDLTSGRTQITGISIVCEIKLFSGEHHHFTPYNLLSCHFMSSFEKVGISLSQIVKPKSISC
jgi:hypothetical protein